MNCKDIHVYVNVAQNSVKNPEHHGDSKMHCNSCKKDDIFTLNKGFIVLINIYIAVGMSKAASTGLLS